MFIIRHKIITTSGGGALICADDESKNNIMWYATQARDAYPYYLHSAIGYNYRMSNICAGIGRGQMTVLEEHIHIISMFRLFMRSCWQMFQVLRCISSLLVEGMIPISG